MVSGCQKDQEMIRGLELSTSPPDVPPGRGVRAKIELLTNGKLFNQSCLCNDTYIKIINNSSLKTLDDRIWRTSRLVHT